MVQLTINIENKAIIPYLKRVLNAIDGVSVVSARKKEKKGIEEAREDVRTGRITRYQSPEEMFDAFGI
ncbi:MAG: response regulator [Muribaculaceae bacterium]|nr:response regulator [Muribaculaceae bacterium]